MSQLQHAPRPGHPHTASPLPPHTQSLLAPPESRLLCSSEAGIPSLVARSQWRPGWPPPLRAISFLSFSAFWGGVLKRPLC